MTHEEWCRMAPCEQLALVATHAGWSEHACTAPEVRTPIMMQGHVGKNHKLYGDGKFRQVPDYLNDLNAIHAALQPHKDTLSIMYWAKLDYVLCHDPDYDDDSREWLIHQATAAQRAEAFVLTMEGT